MAIDLLKQTGINPEAPEYESLLNNLQGNILSGHGRKFSTHLMLQFSSDLQATRAWIATFAQKDVTTARRQYEQAIAYHEQGKNSSGPQSDLFANLFLSAKGYEKLGFSSQAILGASQGRPLDEMKERQADLADPPLCEWDEPFQQEIHAMVLLASNAPVELEDQVT